MEQDERGSEEQSWESGSVIEVDRWVGGQTASLTVVGPARSRFIGGVGRGQELFDGHVLERYKEVLKVRSPSINYLTVWGKFPLVYTREHFCLRF